MNNYYKPKVSVLIPVYNREKFILCALKSAINQTYENIEIIVVDNKSTDRTFELIKEFERNNQNVKVYQNEKNLGPVLNWKKCIEYATGEFVKIIWSDDYIDATFIEKTLPYIIDKEVGFVFTLVEVIHEDGTPNAKLHCYGATGKYNSKDFIKYALLGGPVPGSGGCGIFRRKDIEKNLLVDVPNKVGSDFKMHAIGPDMLIYLLTAKDYPKFVFVNKTLSFFRAHSGSITIGTNNSTMAMTHFLARAYFAENYVTDNKLREKFNARIFLLFLLGHGKKSGIGVKSIKDYYFDQNKAGIDYFYFIFLVVQRVQRVCRVFVRHYLKYSK